MKVHLQSPINLATKTRKKSKDFPPSFYGRKKDKTNYASIYHHLLMLRRFFLISKCNSLFNPFLRRKRVSIGLLHFTQLMNHECNISLFVPHHQKQMYQYIKVLEGGKHNKSRQYSKLSFSGEKKEAKAATETAIVHFCHCCRSTRAEYQCAILAKNQSLLKSE